MTENMTDIGSMPVFTTDFASARSIPEGDLEACVEALRSMRLVPERLCAPMFVLFDITDRCNRRCGYCYNNSGSAAAKHMDREMLFTLARELVQLKVISVCVSGGEASMHPDYVDLIRFFKRNGILAASITNGFDIDRNTAEEMAANLPLIQVTLDGPDAETHDRLRGRGSFARAVATARALKSAGLAKLRIAFTLTAKNADSFPGMKDLALELNAADLRTMPLAQVGRAFHNAGFTPTPDQTASVKAQTIEWASDEEVASKLSVEWGEPHDHIRYGLAYGYVVGMNITPDGRFKVTPYLPITFGDRSRLSLADAWKRGLGKGFVHPRVKPFFERVASDRSFAGAYDAVIADSEARDGYLDLLPGENNELVDTGYAVAAS